MDRLSLGERGGQLGELVALAALVPGGRDERAFIVTGRRGKVAELRAVGEPGRALLTRAAVVAQVWRNGSSQANLARILAGVKTDGLSSRGR